MPALLAKQELWAEPELAVVLGQSVYRADVEEAAAAIAGFTIFNDVTAPEYIPGGLCKTLFEEVEPDGGAE